MASGESFYLTHVYMDTYFNDSIMVDTEQFINSGTQFNVYVEWFIFM